MNKLEEIHRLLVIDERRKAVILIDEYGLYDFWNDYKEYLIYITHRQQAYEYYTDLVISYFRIKNR